MDKVTKVIKESSYNGVILIAKEGNAEYVNAFGYANVEAKEVLQTNHILRIASVSKQFTAVSILDLCQKGKLNLKDTLSTFIPDYPNGDIITIHQILSNTSGIPNFDITMDFTTILESEDALGNLIKVFKNEPLRFTPGSQFEYSNSGYLLLQYIIETISQKGLEEYLRQELFPRIGIQDTYFEKVERPVKRQGKCYDIIDGDILPSPFIDLRIAGGGGALVSTVHDLHLWNQALKDDSLLQDDIRSKLYQKHIMINNSHHYGYGFFLAEGEIAGKHRKKTYHSGGGPGVRSINATYPDDDIEIIMISNINDSKTFNDVHSAVEEIVLHSFS